MSDQGELFGGGTAAGFLPHQGGPDRAPGRTRTQDYPTSREGAESVAYRAGSQKALLLAAYAAAGDRGLTDEEAHDAAGIPDRACWWKRCNELRADGRIVPTGEERPGIAGVNRIVCRRTARED